MVRFAVYINRLVVGLAVGAVIACFHVEGYIQEVGDYLVQLIYCDFQEENLAIDHNKIKPTFLQYHKCLFDIYFFNVSVYKTKLSKMVGSSIKSCLNMHRKKNQYLTCTFV